MSSERSIGTVSPSERSAGTSIAGKAGGAKHAGMYVGWSSRREHWRAREGWRGRQKGQAGTMDGEGEEGGGAVVEGAAEHQK